MAGVPQHVVVTMLDEIAAEDELNLEIAVGIGVREALVDSGRCLRRAAIEAGQRHVRRRVRRRCDAGEQAGADCENGQCSIHCCFFP